MKGDLLFIEYPFVLNFSHSKYFRKMFRLKKGALCQDNSMGERTVFSTNGATINGYAHARE